MPFQIRGKIYHAPNEADQPGLLGKELIQIEDFFGLDALTLLSSLEADKPSTLKGYTRTKALYAFMWICLTRAGEIVSIQDVLDGYSVDEFTEHEADEKKEVMNSSEEEFAAE